MRVLTNVVTERSGEGQDREGEGESLGCQVYCIFEWSHTLYVATW